MTAFWVYLSTVIFLVIVIVKAYKLVIAKLDAQQKEIKDAMARAEAIHHEAHDLYEQYRKKIEKLEIETGQILDKAQKQHDAILESAAAKIEALTAKKQADADRQIAAYAQSVQNNMITKYANQIKDGLVKNYH